MANVYVRSGAGGAGTGADWANAYTTLSAALAAKSAGDDFWVSEDHAESTASAVTLTSPGTSASPCKIMCVNHSGSVPPVSADLATTATVAVTGANNLTLGGIAYCYGISFSAGNSTNTGVILWTSSTRWEHKLCSFTLANGTSASSQIRVNAASTRVIWDNCTVSFGNVNQGIRNSGQLLWKNTASAIGGATFPTNLFDTVSSGITRIYGVDLSALGSGKTIISDASNLHDVRVSNCKLNASVTKAATPSASYKIDVDYIRSDSSGTNYKFERISYFGSETTETTIIRTGGASDGTQGISKKIVTSANSRVQNPFQCFPISVWNDNSGSSKTLSIEGTWGGGAVPNNDDIWIEVEYLGDASSPMTSFVSNGKADILASNSAHSSSAESWGGGTTNFKMSVSFTPAQKGPVVVRVVAAAASTTFYVCPKVSIA